MRGIIAVNRLGYIGLNGQLPWKSSEDLKHFKKLTMDGKLLVGFNTYSTLPPLEGRSITIDTRSLSCDDRYPSVNYDEIDWCIGGKTTYEKHCHRFTELHISYINDETIGDMRMPDLIDLSEDCKVFHYFFNTD